MKTVINLLALVILLGVANLAYACSCVTIEDQTPESVRRSFFEAENVVVAKVISVKQTEHDNDLDGQLIEEVTFKVIESLRGSLRLGDTVVTRSGVDAGNCGISVKNDPPSLMIEFGRGGAVPAKFGDDWLIYGRNTQPYKLSRCSRSAALRIVVPAGLGFGHGSYDLSVIRQMLGQSKAIDLTFEGQGDVTGDGVPETLTYRVSAKSLRSPFTWKFTIKSKAGRTLFSYSEKSIWTNAPVDGDEEEVVDCKGFEICKTQYFFKTIPEQLFSVLAPRKTEALYQDDMVPVFRSMATDYLRKHHYSDQLIKRVLDEMYDKLSKPGAFTLDVPDSTMDYKPLMIWVDAVGKFVPYYHE